jgi:hypothetical protein
MARVLVSFFSCSIVGLVLSTAACSGGAIAVGKTNQTDQELKTKKDGTPTGNGQSCSWDDTVAYDVATGETTTTPSKDAQYSLGDEFKSLDGCNDCTCTARGIMCTLRSCGGGSSPGNPGQGCSLEAKICPDGSSVGRGGPNCEFSPCPGGNDIACTNDAKICPDGSYVGREGPKCEFKACPSTTDPVCAADVKLCPGGSYVSRRGPKCEFAPCP